MEEEYIFEMRKKENENKKEPRKILNIQFSLRYR